MYYLQLVIVSLLLARSSAVGIGSQQGQKLRGRGGNVGHSGGDRWPQNAPSNKSLIHGHQSVSDGPSYVRYPAEWQPDGHVFMDGSQPSTHGDWSAVCYTPEKAKALGVDMQGYKLGSKLAELHAVPNGVSCTKKDIDNNDKVSVPLDHAVADGSAEHGLQMQTVENPAPLQPGDSSSLVHSVPLTASSSAVSGPGLQMSVSPVKAQTQMRGNSTDIEQDNLPGLDTSPDNIFKDCDHDGDGTLDLLDVLVMEASLARRAKEEEDNRHPFAFEFQHLVMRSMLQVDQDNDSRVHMNSLEFSTWWHQEYPMIRMPREA